MTVIAKEFASPDSGKRITSEIAGALWEWPPAVCGSHVSEEALERAKVWCMESYAKFVEMAISAEQTGVFMKQSVFYFKDKVEDIPAHFEKMKEISHLPGFQHEKNLIEQTGKLRKPDATRVSVGFVAVYVTRSLNITRLGAPSFSKGKFWSCRFSMSINHFPFSL